MRKSISMLLVLAMLCTFSACGKAPNRQQIEGAGFDTSEEAVTAYLEAMKTGDVEKMISTFAIETYVDHFDLTAMIDQMGSYIFRVDSNEQRLDTIDNYTRSLNIGKRAGNLYNDLIRQYMFITNGDALDQYLGKTQKIPSGDFSSGKDVVSFLMDPDWLNNLSKLKILTIENAAIKFAQKPCFATESRFTEYQENARDKYGCQEIAEIVAEFELDGENYYLIMELVNYDGKWYNRSFLGYCASAFGLMTENAGVIPVDELND